MKIPFRRLDARRLIVCGAAMILMLVPAGLQAQVLEQIKPQPVPETARPKAPETKPGAGEAPKGPELEKPLGINLKGLAFFARPSEVFRHGLVLDPKAPTDRLVISAVAVPALQDPAFAERLKPYHDIALTMGVLGKIQDEVIDYFQSIDRSYVAVSIPPQDISSGVVQFVVIESKLGNVGVKGSKWFSEDEYLSHFRLKKGEPITQSTLKDDIAWINRNPFRTADVVAEAGKEFGTTDMTLVTNERFPVRVYGGYDNNGPKLSGRDRFLAGLNWGNAFGLGHEFNYQHTRSNPDDLSQGHSGSYVVPLPWRHIVSLNGAYSKTNANLPQPFNSTGETFSVDAYYVAPLKSQRNYSHQVSLRIPFKFSDNTLVFSQIPITNNATHILQAELTYSGTWKNPLGQLGFYATLVGSPGGMTSRNKDRFFNISRAGASASYAVGRMGLNFSAPLPEGFRWSTAMSGQLASDNLLGSEQFGLAGVQAVRGYDQGLVYRDRGFLARNELITPAFSILGRVPAFVEFAKKKKLPKDALSLLAFFDFGVGGNVNLLPGEKGSILLASTGLGARYAFGPFLSFNLDYGWQLSSDPIDTNSRQLHASVTFGY